jgi:hypothetical protein
VAVTEWEPATEAEAAMRDALRAQDQQLYFRILTRTDLLLPVSTEAVAGRAPLGWGTWTTGGRTHVLAFTSPAALRACLGENAGTTRRVPYADLAAGWPNHEWWLAVNPGLPIEGYLPAWFVAQLSRGDVRLPGRTMGARARLERAESAARARANGFEPDAPVSPAPGPLAPAAGRPTAAPREPSTVPIPTVPTAPVPPPVVPAPATVPVPPPATPPPAVPLAATPPPPVPPARSAAASAGAAADRLTRLPLSRLAQRRAGQVTEQPPAADAAAEPPPARNRAGSVPPRSPLRAEPGAESISGWLDDLRRRPDEEDPFGTGTPARPAAEPGNGRPGTPEAPAGRSFFEPASGRMPRRMSPLDKPRRTEERAAPPSRLGQGSQPFPRRRPLSEPVREEPGRAFRFDAPAEEATQAIPRSRPQPGTEDAPAFPAAPPSDTTQALPRRRPLTVDGPEPEERTQPLPPPTAAPVEEPEELPPTVAEPVSAPPASRRGFSPIVIEGTIIESRDLDPTEPVTGPDAPAPWSGPAGAPPADPVPSSAAERPPSWAGPVASAPPPPWSGTEDATAPLTAPADPPVSRAASDGATTPLTAPDDRTAPLPEPPAPWAGSDDRTAPLAEPPAPWAGSDDGTTSPESWTGADGHAAPAASWGGTDDSTAPLPEPPASWAGIDDSTAPIVPSSGSGAGPDDSTAPLPPPPETVRPAGRSVPAADAAPAPTASVPVDFLPANEVEEDLLGAAGSGSTDSFLSTLLLARVLLPTTPESAPGSRPGEPGFVWRTEELDGETYVVVYTSPERLADRADGPVDTVLVRFVQLIRRWPDEDWSFAVNPGTPVGAKYPGEQVVGLANWAAEVGLGDEEGEPEQPVEEPVSRPRPAPPAIDPTRPVTMQKAIAPSQLAYYLERGYDRVSGFVHRAGELAHLNTPAQLFDALGLGHPDSPFTRDADEIYVLRWPAYRPSLYRIPYGGQNEPAMRAMEGWVIERAPFRGNGFAPGESSDVVAEFKVDSARLPHGAQLWRIGADGSERVVAILDTDALLWRQVGGA